MTQPHQRRLKAVQFALDGQSFECQLRNWNFDPGEQDGDRLYTFCPDETGANQVIEETDPEPELTLEFLSDWRVGGISDFLWQNRGQMASVSIVHHPGRPDERVQFSGQVLLKAPAVGGEVRTTEVQEVTMQVLFVEPLYQRSS